MWPPVADGAVHLSAAQLSMLLEGIDWLTERLSKLSRKSALAEAMGYALKRWAALTRYVTNGRIEIDNNAAERALRTVALGRKNYLFAGSDAGGERTAAIYSLIGTATLNGIDPEAWLRHVIARIADHPVNRVDDPMMRQSILDNLVSNAVRYTDAGGVLIAARPRGRDIELQVWDTGPGIAENVTPHIFMPYRRFDDRQTRHEDGQGLGLALARKQAELLGHALDVRSRVGRGSIFALRLPQVDLRPG